MLKLFQLSFFLLVLGPLSACGGSARPADIAPAPAATVPAATPLPPSAEAPTPTNEAASVMTPQATGPAPATGTALNFKLSGGFVGFCDELTVDTNGTYILRRPCADPPELSGTLAQPDLDSLISWVQNLASFQVKAEDNPGGPDSMTSELSFTGQGSTEADEAQQQLIIDWVNSLLVRVRPQAVAPPPSPESVAIGPEGLCPDIARPAVVTIDFERPGGFSLINPDTQASCDFQLDQPPYGRMVTVAGQIYYAVHDPEAKTVTIWRLAPTGEKTALAFTTTSMAEFGPFSFTVSSDGSKIAWARAVPNFEVDPPLYLNDLWLANMDGSNQVTLLDQVEQERSYVEPVRFSLDQNTLYYALQPDGLGGMMFSFSGRYNSLYRLPVSGGEAQLFFACPEGQPICIGDISPDGSTLAYVQAGQGIVLLGSDGQIISTVTPPATDFVGSPVFGPNGNLAFVSATLTQPSEQALPRPNPGYISLITPPYTEAPRTLFSDNRVTIIWEWLDENRLIYGSMTEDVNLGTALVTLEGQQFDLSASPAIAVLR